jgi:hypoxanthine phosphoribosyltransferase
MAHEINAFYGWEKGELVVVGLADGASIFLSDLIRSIPFKISLNFVKVKTYCGTEKVGRSRIDTGEFSDDFCHSMEGNNVLIVDDVFDTGESLQSVWEAVNIFGPKTIKTAVLINKYKQRDCEIKPDFVGFNVADKFIVGYGMDYNNYYRNLTDICVLNMVI